MMYLLLRDNKESGPYSLDDLKTLGLKAYDLVWVDGRSAAWRYPSELEELRSFAPIIEEQPFDRFYKKSSSESDANTVLTANVSEHTTLAEPKQEPLLVNRFEPTPSPVYASERSSVSGKRIIYVTMPAGKGTAVLHNSKPQPKQLQQPVIPVPLTATAVHEDMSRQTDNPTNAVEYTPQKQSGRSRGWQLLGVAACILALLAGGIFIGLSINKENIGFGKKVAVQSINTNSVNIPPVRPGLTAANVPDSLTNLAPAKPSAVLVTAAASGAPDPVNTNLLVAGKRATNDVTIVKQRPVHLFAAKDKVAPGHTALPPTILRDSSGLGIPVVHREATHRTDLPAEKSENADKDLMKNNIANLVSVGTNGYTVGTFGGISGLQLTVSNRSVYSLDLVVVEVQYIQANKKVFKTENLYFRGISGGAALMQEAPKSTRGIKVLYKITLVNSKELGLSYSGI